MSKLQREIKLVEDNYGPDHLNLVLARGYVASMLERKAVSRYLAQNYGEILNEFKRISEAEAMGAEAKL